MTTYFAWIVYADQHGGDTEIDAQDAIDALGKALEWAKRGTYDAGNTVEVNVMPMRDPMGRLEPEVWATFVAA
jgi:hypothetical protein